MTTPYRSVAAWQQGVPPRIAELAAPAMPPLLAAAAGATVLLLLAPHLVPGGAPHDAGLAQLAQARFYRNLDWMASHLGADSAVPALAWACKVLVGFGGCFALLWIGVQLAAAEGIGLAVGGGLIGLSYLTGGAGFVTGGGLATGAMTWTQVGVVLVLLATALALEARLLAAIALLGVAANADPGAALWGACAVAGAAIGLAWGGTRIGRAASLGVGAGAVLALPRWLQVARSAPHAALPGSHAMTVVLLQTHRWTLWLVPLPAWLLLVCTLVLGLAACSSLGPDARAARGALLGVVAIFLLGCALPFLTADPVWLGLRLAAADKLMQLLCAALATAVVLRDLRHRNGLLRVTLSVLVAACLLLHPYLVPVAALAMLARAAAAQGELLGIERRMREWSSTTLLRAAIVAVVLAAIGGVVLQSGPLPFMTPG